MKENKWESENKELISFLQKEIEKQVSGLTPIGAIQAFAMNEAPEDWLACDGTEYNITETTQKLFDVIGNTFGGDGHKTFCVPDLRGRFVRGWDMDGNIDPERELGSSQDDAMQGHSHSVDSSKITIQSSGKHTHTTYASKYSVHDTTLFSSHVDVIKWLADADDADDADDSAKTSSAGSHKHKIKIASNFFADMINSKYGQVRCNTETRPKNVALLYCIKY